MNEHFPDNNRRRVNLTIDEQVMAEAKALGLNASRAAEAGIRAAINKRQEQVWLEEHREKIAAYNERIDQEGTLLTPHWLER